MIVFLHVLIALSSIVAVSVAYVWPSKLRLRISYATIAMTLASGTYLVVLSPSRMLHTCIIGLAYTAVVLVGIMATRVKLARITLAASV